MNNRILARALATTAVLAVLGTTAACGGGGSNPAATGGAGAANPDSQAAIDAALAQGGKLTYWTWTPQAKAQVAAFQKAYPKVEVTLVNTASASDNNLKLQNAISAGSGAPDVVQLEYQSLPQFVLKQSLVDLTEYGFGDLKDLYTPSTWGAVTQGGVWGLPQDSGPMALFYNKRVFDKHKVAVPKTWDEYVAAGRTLHAADKSIYITNDAGGDAGFGTSMIWQAGGRPFKVDGENVAVNLQDEGTKKWAATWNTLVSEGLMSQISGWSDEWFAGLADGKIATLPIGAWMPGVLESGAKGGAGDWAVAPMPTYDGGAPVTAENGGSSQVVVKQSANPALAAGFLRWLNSSDESIDVFLAGGGFPATVKQLNAPAFLEAKSAYFGGQQINKVLVDAAKSVGTGWQYLPWQG
ncbi:multiple sugar transport system substrate-binding protein [Kineosphaera limosa]|uniref:Putative sugar ABC transporter substrate-binding protein n=1 Tax=Kineosphaera limosa NBRC 100340 TaxID=1184609 RepID=K6WTX6_9MICO|nr:sugar ABC transporter substrate-binding protein [Kineosphaera limosa]NYD99896.1 multiple sugar transport system substrate-binding protein [Kineosphaera limosa]GAB95567.1 putative sugar ABC transporter substrate-binding protein [Kineosphaera limosa NBRC 100340]